MSDLVQATIVGRLTKDAELRQAGSGTVCGFRIAATPYKSESLFFDVSVWGRRGEALSQYLTKGQQVCVVGDYSERQYEAGGEKRTNREINATAVALVGGGSRQERPATQSDGDDADSGLPF